MHVAGRVGSNKEEPSRSNSSHMKTFSLLLLASVLGLAVSCEKPQSTAERDAQVEREVQQRLASERLTADQQKLAQDQADLAAREQALTNQQTTTTATTTTESEAVASSRDEENDN